MQPSTSLDFGPLPLERAPELVRMWRTSFEQGVDITDPNPIEDQLHHFLNEVVPSFALHVAFAGERIVGFVAASPDTVNQLHVHPDHQDRGIGKYLLGWAKARSNGSLWLYTYARNLRACAFYERNGFLAVARGFEPVWQLADVKYAWSARTAEAE